MKKAAKVSPEELRHELELLAQECVRAQRRLLEYWKKKTAR